MARHHHSFAKESLITGLLGALAVALWFGVRSPFSPSSCSQWPSRGSSGGW